MSSQSRSFFAVTLPVNIDTAAQPLQLQLSQAQLFAALIFKARDPSRFVDVIEECKVLEEYESGLLREVRFKDAPAPVHELVEFVSPGLVTFAMRNPQTGEQLAHVTNMISTSPTGALLLTFAFIFSPHGGPFAGKNGEECMVLAERTVAQTLRVARQLVRESKI